MLTRYRPKTKLIEKFYTRADGKTIRVLFLVALVGGELKAKLISAELADNYASEKSSCSDYFTDFTRQSGISFLPVECKKSINHFQYIPSYSGIISPYNQLTFFISQPTRAPSSD
jgi:hypothetical protein